MDENQLNAYKLLESLRSRAGTEQFSFLNLYARSIQLFIQTALVLNGGSIIALNTFVGTGFAERFFGDGKILPLFFILLPSLLFFSGIIFAVRSFHFNYLNYRYCMDIINRMWEEEMRPVKDEHLKINYNSRLLPEAPKFSILSMFPKFFKFLKILKIVRKNKNASDSNPINSTAVKGLKSAYLSYVFFTVGYGVVAIILSISVICIR